MNVDAPPPPMRVVLADSHALFRDSLRSFLVVSGIEVPAAVASGLQAIEAARGARFDVALIDLHLDGLGGIETTRRLAEELPELPILLLATSRFDAELREGIRRGASGYVFKGEDPDVVLRTIIAAAQGTPILSPELARYLMRDLEQEASGASPRDRGLSLTIEEANLLSGIAASAHSEVAGAALGRSIFAKLHRLHRKPDGGAAAPGSQPG
jgi:DNA-binding NarL/FixJ family response regulator